MEKHNRRSSLSRNAILDAAEMLFGQSGPEGVSLRQISTEAGSANNSAVQYHFKNKEGLIDGIFDRRLASLEKRRALLLENLIQQGLEKSILELLRALLLPIADEKDSSGRCSFAAFLLGLRMFGNIDRWHVYSDSAPVTVEINRLLRKSLPSLSNQTFNTRLLSAVSVFLISVVDWDRRDVFGQNEQRMTREEYLQNVLDFSARGMTG